MTDCGGVSGMTDARNLDRSGFGRGSKEGQVSTINKVWQGEKASKKQMPLGT